MIKARFFLATFALFYFPYYNLQVIMLLVRVRTRGHFLLLKKHYFAAVFFLHFLHFY